MMQNGQVLAFKKIYSSLLARRLWSGRLTAPDIVALIFLAIFVILRLPYFLGQAYVPDEQFHTLTMEKLFLENREAFGASYWLAGHAIFLLFGGYALVVMRVLAFLSILYTAFSIYRISREQNRTLAPLIFIFAISSPVFWFGGKLITPEFYQFALISLVAVQIFCKKSSPWWVYVIMGFVLGVKLSSITLVLFIGLIYTSEQGYFCLKDTRNCKELLKILVLLSIGYVSSSPNILFDLAGYKRLFFSNFGHSNSLQPNFLIMKTVLWDYIQDWGLLYYLNPLVIILFAIFMIATRNWKILAAGTLCIGLLLALIFKNQLFYSWHAFSTVAILWFGFATAAPRKIPSRWFQYTCLIVCISLNISVVAQQVPVDWATQKEFFDFEKNKGSYDDCLRRFSQRNAPLWHYQKPVMCYNNYRVNAKREGFCDVERLSNVMSTDTWHPKILKLYETTRPQLKDLLTKGPIIFLTNEHIAQIYGVDSGEQNTYLRGMMIELKDQESFSVESKVIATCEPYKIIEYSGPKATTGIHK